MGELFYAKYKNAHITNDFNHINPHTLAKGDNVCILYGDNVKMYNLQFHSISNNNIVEFMRDNSDKWGAPRVYYSTDYNNYNSIDANDIIAYYYYDNNKYIPLIYTSQYDNLPTSLMKHLIKKTGNNTNSRYLSGVYDNQNEIYSYLIFPSEDEGYIKLLLNIGLSKKYDYLVYLKPMKDIGYYISQKFEIDTSQIMEILNTKKSKSIQWFNDFLFSKNYNTQQYIEDKNKDKNLKFVNNFLETNFNKKCEINTCFENKKLGIKSYIENGYVIIGHNDTVINYSCGKYYFNFFDTWSNGEKVAGKKYIDDIELQHWLRIAYDIAYFNLKKSGINPMTGNYEVNGVVDNHHIIYEDAQYKITAGGYDKKYYEKIYDKYFITVDDSYKIKDIMDLYKTFTTLSEN